MIEIGIARYLEAEGVVNFDEEGGTGNAFIGRMPSSPDQAVMLMSTGGFEADSELGYDNPTFQVLVRGTQDPRVAHAKAQDIYSALHGLGPITLPDGTRLVSCVGIQSGPVGIGSDSNGRYEFSLNFQAEIRSLTTHRV